MSLLSGFLNPSKTDIGHNQEENHVSKQSSSCLKSAAVKLELPDFSFAKSSANSAVAATT